ncbi:MAG: hemolysin family protein [Acidobacteriota bacterium]
MTAYALVASGSPLGPLEINPVTGVLLAGFLVFLNGFFVAAEFALVKVRPTQLDAYTDSRRGRVADHMVEHLDAYLSATQLGITLASLGLGWVGEPAVSRLIEPLLAAVGLGTPAVVHTASLVVGFSIISMLHIVLGELAPKSLAIRKPEPTSLWVAIPLFAFYKVTFPAIWLLNQMANAILRLVGIAPVTEGELAHSEEEIRRLLASHEDAEIGDEKRELLDNIFELSERTARQVMVPRADVVFLDTEAPMDENLTLAKRSGHTRFPLCERELDSVLGLVHIKDLFRADEMPESLDEVRREALFVPETQSLEQLLRRMKRSHIHMAAVLDEYGGVSGIVTLENVIEEIVGEIQDEFDFERPELVELGDGVYRILGSMLVEEVEEELDLDLGDDRDEDTLAGVALSEIGRRARVGDTVDFGPLALEILEVEQNRILSLKVTVDRTQTVSEA